MLEQLKPMTIRSTMLVALVAVLSPVAAHATDSCAAICSRIAECNFDSYDGCMDYCSSHPLAEHPSNPKEGFLRRQGASKWSCQQLAPYVAPSRHSEPAGARGDSSRAAAGGSSPSGDNCAAICARFEQCRLWSHDSCTDFCAAHTSDPAQNLIATKWSCEKLGAWKERLEPSGSGSGSGSGSWACRAVATYLRNNSDGSPDYSDPVHLDVTKYSTNRDQAGIAAINECSGLLRLEAVTFVSPKLITESCHVISCSR